MEIAFNNKTFDGRYQGMYVFLMDINDILGKPVTFVIGSGNTFRNFNINVTGWNRKSTKYKFAEFLRTGQETTEGFKE